MTFGGWIIKRVTLVWTYKVFEEKNNTWFNTFKSKIEEFIKVACIRDSASKMLRVVIVEC